MERWQSALFEQVSLYFEYRKNPPKSKIKNIVIKWLKIMFCLQTRGGKKMGRGQLAPSKSQSQFWPLFNSNIGKIPEIKDQGYCLNQMIENHVVRWQKRGGKKMERGRLAPSKSHSANVSKCQQLSKAFSCFTRAHIAIWQRRVATITIITTTKTATRTRTRTTTVANRMRSWTLDSNNNSNNSSTVSKAKPSKVPDFQ